MRARRGHACGRATCSCSTIRTTAAPICPTSPWSRRCSTTSGAERPCSTSPRAATTPTSAASRRAPCRRFDARSTRRACCSTTAARRATARFREAGDRARCSPRRRTRRAIRTRTSPTCGRRSPPTQKGVDELRRMVEQFGLDVVQAYMGHVQDNAEESVRRVHRRRCTTARSATRLDNGAVITCRDRAWTASARGATIDFTGTSAAAADQLQRARPRSAWPRCCTSSARWSTTTSRSTPAACKPLEIVVPEGLDAEPALSGRRGRRATSRPRSASRTRSTARSASMAAAQGTMNNFTFGNDARTSTTRPSRAAPARATGFDGADAVQTHMTNSRLTDPEVLEWRFPVRLDSFAIRRGSGGARALARRRRRSYGACASWSR